ncbi:ZBED4 protein, partial [Amia calva]|nr:ZBED4 protein [Amia calva]
ENLGFRRLLHTLEPKYTILSRAHFTHTVVTNLYNESKAKLVQTLKEAESIAITTDGWTSRGTQSYITITAHTINSDWEMVNVVLQTRLLFESHTGANIAEDLQAAVTDWELNRPNHGIAIVTDNARNMDVAVREAGLEPHTINLATQAGLGVPRVTRSLGRVRRVAAFFHRSSTATAVLMSKQKLLQLPSHKLIMDVTTRWNSTLDMLDRYLEQQAAIAAALTSPEIRQNARNTLDSCDITDAEDLVKLLNPLKTATTVLCDEKSPTLSLIVPLKSMIEQSMTPNDGDSTTRREQSSVIFRADTTGMHTTNCWRAQRWTPAGVSEERGEEAAGGAHYPTHGGEGALGAEAEVTEPASKKTALEDLLGDSFFTEPEQPNRGIERENELYRREASIPLSSCPLKWWRENGSQYPLLSPIAKAYLSIPATSVPSECVFSTAGNIVTAQRSQLLPENIDMLIFLKKNMTIS